MKTKDSDYSKFDESYNTAAKFFSESTSAMADLYNKQFKLGYDMLTSFQQMPGSDNNKGNDYFNLNPFTSAFEILKKNFDSISELSLKSMTSVMHPYLTPGAMHEEDQKKMTGSIFDAYNLIIKQFEESNQQFFKTFNGTFKTTNEDGDKLYDIFHKNLKSNFWATEEAINTIVKTYTTIADKSSKDTKEMLDSINKQIELMAKQNLDLLSDILSEAGTQEKKNHNNKETKHTKTHK